MKKVYIRPQVVVMPFSTRHHLLTTSMPMDPSEPPIEDPNDIH